MYVYMYIYILALLYNSLLKAFSLLKLDIVISNLGQLNIL